MDRAPSAPVHLVPPLPQRRSSRSQSVTRVAVSSTSSSSPLTLTRNELRQQSESTSGRLPSRRSSSPRRLPNLHRISPTQLRAVNNDYGDVPPTTPKLLSQLHHQQQQQPAGDSNRFGFFSRDVIVEMSSSGEPMSRTTSGAPFIDGNIDGRSKSDKAAAVERLSKPSDDGVETDLSQQLCRESIICADCGKCRCAECARPATPALCCVDTGSSSSSPSSGTGCQRAFDSLTCMTCVRAAFRHRHSDQSLDDDGDDDAGGPPYGYDDDELCSCQPTSARCCRRWTLLIMLSACLPCLCLYLPLRCLCRACANLHSSCAAASHRGCRCRPPTTLPPVIDGWQSINSKPLQLPQPSKDAKYISVDTTSSGGVRV